MSIIEIDKRPAIKIAKSKSKQSWQNRFRKNIYYHNYAKTLPNTEFDDPILEDKKSQGIVSLINLIKQSKTVSAYLQQRQFYDPQNMQTYYSPYSTFIPLQDQSYMKDEVNNTFPYIGHLIDTAKRLEAQKYYQDIHLFFKGGKTNGKQYVQNQWKKVKSKYICQLDSIQAVTLLIQLTRKNSKLIEQLYRKYSKSCLKQIFFFRVTRTSMYIRALLKMNKNLKVSMQVGIEINYITLPETMKTWYCALCMSYDCEKHRLEPKAVQYDHQYISCKNKKPDPQHIQNIIKLLKFYEQLKSETKMIQQSKSTTDTCSQSCYLKLTKMDIPKLIKGRHMLISPLAKSLLKLGIQMFSYNPCHIHQLFQSKYDTKNINCNLIFIHFAQQCNLTQLIQIKMCNSEVQYLKNQNSKKIDCLIKIPSNTIKPKRLTYSQKRSKNQNPQFAVCMHNFVGHQIVDPNCSQCVCRQRGFCLPSCLCSPNCEIPRQHCVCRGADTCQTDKCLCFSNKMQCQPGVCGDCFQGKNQKKKNNCCNDQLLRGRYRKIAIGISHIPGAGIGAFAGQKYKKNDLVVKYSGQHINSDIDHIRQSMIKDLSFYNFDSPNGKVIGASIDARFMGNKARFINHGNEGQCNLKAETILSNGTEYIALYAAREIQEGEELKFNYDGSGDLYSLHRDKYPFIKASKKKD